MLIPRLSLYSSFENTLNHQISQLSTDISAHIILALSGGMDSRVLLELLALYRNQYPQHHYQVIHVHHGLSPNADAWLAQCEHWAKAANFSFRAVRVAIDKTQGNIESAARTARYQAILACAKPNALILTGQHADDQTETFLLALKRGSGPKGLASMPVCRPFAHAYLIRPLLEVTRAQIEQFACAHQLDWIEDESNQDTHYDRNFIRQTWLPIAKARWPQLGQAIQRTAALCAAQEALLDELLTDYDAKMIQADGGFCLRDWAQFSSQLQSALLRRWLRKSYAITPSFAQLNQIQTTIIAAASDANPILQLGPWQIRRFQKRLYVVPAFKDVTNWRSELVDNVPLQLPDGLGVIGLYSDKDYSGLSLKRPSELTSIYVRFDSQGLLAHPVGRQGKRQLKKLFQEYGIPSWQRRRIPIIFYGDTLVAIADLFVCKGFDGTDLKLNWQRDLV